MQTKEQEVLTAIKKADPPKKRVTFFISEESKAALASWCEKNGVTESSAIEQMVRATVPSRYFKEEK